MVLMVLEKSNAWPATQRTCVHATTKRRVEKGVYFFLNVVINLFLFKRN
jgi:hypothetical protein